MIEPERPRASGVYVEKLYSLERIVSSNSSPVCQEPSIWLANGDSSAVDKKGIGSCKATTETPLSAPHILQILQHSKREYWQDDTKIQGARLLS